MITADSGDGPKTEKIIGIMESKIKDIGRIVQKRTKEGNMRFSILPIIRKDEPTHVKDDQAPILEPVEELETKINDPEDASSPPAKINKIQARSYHTLSL